MEDIIKIIELKIAEFKARKTSINSIADQYYNSWLNSAIYSLNDILKVAQEKLELENTGKCQKCEEYKALLTEWANLMKDFILNK